MTSGRIQALFLLLITLVAGLFVIDLMTGSAQITLAETFRALTGGLPADDPDRIIVFELRLPKAITAILAGAALPVAGLMMQTYFRNPVAGPDILGVSAGSSLFVAFVMLTGVSIGVAGSIPIILAAIIGAFVVLFVILVVSARIRDAMTLLIFGIMFGMAISAIVGVLQYYSDRGALKLFMLWTFGSLGGVTWQQLYLLFPLIGIGLFSAWMLSGRLNVLLAGESYAQSMGVRIRQVRNHVIISTAILTGAITAFCGPIAFIGIAVPHLARMVFRINDHRILLPGSMLMGAALLLLCDMLTQIPGEAGLLPLNSITACMGAPFIIFILWKHQHLRRSF